ncbi:MAG: DoxX family protein, partial [Chitinophagaceae bacterium]
LSSASWHQNNGISLVRIIVGFFMIYHGWEIFDTGKMNGYLDWDMFKGSSTGKFLVYLGKGTELAGGVFLFLGLFTRIACIVLIGTMAYIAFFVGHGKIWYDDQHPFLFVLLGVVFIFTGPGSWSMDGLIFGRKAISR